MKKYHFNPKKLNIGYFGSIYNSRGIEMLIKISEIDNKNNEAYYIFTLAHTYLRGYFTIHSS